MGKQMIRVLFGDNLDLLKKIDSESIDLIYIDPPFNTGKTQKKTTIRTRRSSTGDRVGFKGQKFETEKLSTHAYNDQFSDFRKFIEPRLLEAYRVLKNSGALYFHIDYRESHYCKILLDEIFGRDSFLNEIIWAYDYGGRTRKKWAPKHDTILYYVKDPENYTFNIEAIDRVPYMAPGLVSPAKRALGKLPTDTWWHTIVPTNGNEKTGYPTQKPLGVLRRIIAASSNPGDTVLDFFAGSGTTGAACLELGRDCILMDNNPEAIAIIKRRLGLED